MFFSTILVFLLLKYQSTQCAYLKVFSHISEIQQGRIMKCLICFFVHMDMPVLIVYIFGRFILQPREKGWMSEIKALWINFKMLSNVCFDLIFNSPEKMLKRLISNTWVRTHSSTDSNLVIEHWKIKRKTSSSAVLSQTSKANLEKICPVKVHSFFKQC